MAPTMGSPYREIARAATACPKWRARCKRTKVATPVRAWSRLRTKTHCPRKCVFSALGASHTWRTAVRQTRQLNLSPVARRFPRSRVALARLGASSHISEVEPSLSMSARGRAVPISVGRQCVLMSQERAILSSSSTRLESANRPLRAYLITSGNHHAQTQTHLFRFSWRPR